MTTPVSGPSTVAWFHCFAGIAGDMALGSLVDAGADVDEVRALLDRLALPGWHLEFEEGIRGGIACTRAIVGGDDVVVRTHGVIAALIEDAALPARVTARAQAVFHKLASVESALHRRPIDQVHFHEVGGHDAIIDIVGTAAALEVLGVDEVCASAVATGMGMVRSAHGRLPNPAPATVRLLEGIPTYGRDVPIELTTPTGAALLAALSTHVRAPPRHDGRVLGIRWGRRRDGRPAELHPGRHRAAVARSRRSVPASRRTPARDEPRRRHGGAAGARRLRPRSRRARSTPGSARSP